MTVTNKYLIEGLDRLGKDTLINGILNKRGYHQVLHFSKPVELDCYIPCPTGMTAKEIQSEALREYQKRSFRNMFSMLRDATFSHIICNRAHLGEYVYAPLYRDYAGEYVFDIERQFMQNVTSTRLILLVEDFTVSKHFIDDGESFDITKREREQDLFLEAFHQSSILDKRIVNVTAPDGSFRNKLEILDDVLVN